MSPEFLEFAMAWNDRGLTKLHWYDKLEYQEVRRHVDDKSRYHGRRTAPQAG